MKTDVLDDRISDVLWVVVGVLLLRFGFRVWSVVPPADPAGALLVVLLYATAVGALVLALAAATPVYGRYMAAWVTLIAVYGAGYVVTVHTNILATDALLFSQYSTDLVLNAENPYSHSMLPALTEYGVPRSHVTPTTSGGIVESLSYPAGAVLAFIPGRIISGVRGVAFTPVVFLGAAVVGSSYLGHDDLTALPVLASFAPRNLWYASVRGVFDAIWVLPLLGVAVAWYLDRHRSAGAAYGVAAGMKQQPWICGPFLLLWAVHRWGWRRAATWLGVAVGVFAVINAPLFVSDPGAWMSSVFTPVGSSADLVQQGGGLVYLSVNGAYALPDWYFTVAVGVVTVTALFLYGRGLPRTGPVAFVTPAVVLLFHDRSLHSYFAFTAFLAAAVVTVYISGPDAVRNRVSAALPSGVTAT